MSWNHFSHDIFIERVEWRREPTVECWLRTFTFPSTLCHKIVFIKSGELRNELSVIINSCLSCLHKTPPAVIQFIWMLTFLQLLIFSLFSLLSFLVLPPSSSASRAPKLEDFCRKIDEEETSSMSSIATNSSQPSRRLIKADYSLFKVNVVKILSSGRLISDLEQFSQQTFMEITNNNQPDIVFTRKIINLFFSLSLLRLRISQRMFG